jgi:hypothetical protein
VHFRLRLSLTGIRFPLVEVDQPQTLRRPADQMANVPKLEIVVDDTSGVKGAVEVYYRFAG